MDECPSCLLRIEFLQKNQDKFFSTKLPTPEIKRKFFADKISNYDDKLVVFGYKGEEILYDYDSIDLMIEQLKLRYSIPSFEEI